MLCTVVSLCHDLSLKEEETYSNAKANVGMPSAAMPEVLNCRGLVEDGIIDLGKGREGCCGWCGGAREGRCSRDGEGERFEARRGIYMDR